MATLVQVAANLILNELSPRLKKAGIEIKDSPVKPFEIHILAAAKLEGVVSTHEIRQILDKRIHPAC